MAQLVVRRLAVRQAWVRISARHPMEVLLLQSGEAMKIQEDRPRRMAKDEWMYVYTVWIIVKNNKYQKEWHNFTKSFKKVIMWHHVWIYPWSAAGSHQGKKREKKKPKSINQTTSYLSAGTAWPCGAHLPEVVFHVERKQVGGGDSQAQPNIPHLQPGVNGYRLLAGNAKIDRNLP